MRLISSMRAALRAVARWRTVYLLEQADADAESLQLLRDAIPHALRALAQEKADLLAQLERFSEPGAPVAYLQPNTHSYVGHFFQRTKQ